MEEELTILQMVINILEHINMESQTVTEYIHGKMEVSMKVSLFRDSNKAKENGRNIFLSQASLMLSDNLSFMKVIMKGIKSMGWEFSHGLVVMYTKENTEMMKEKAMEK
jgi:hypothetical protein